MQLELDPIIVATSCDREDICRQIAETVLKKKLAACVQVSGPVKSSYWWENEIAEDDEYLVSMKTEKRLFGELSKLIRSIHSYDVPELIATQIIDIDEPYARWLKEALIP